MYRCQLCGIEHDFDICPYCGTVRQASPTTLRLSEDAAERLAADDEPIKLTEAASGRIRKSSRDGHRPPPAPKNQPTLLRDVSPVFTPDPSSAVSNGQEESGQAGRNDSLFTDIYADTSTESHTVDFFDDNNDYLEDYTEIYKHYAAAGNAAQNNGSAEKKASAKTPRADTAEKPTDGAPDDDMSAYFASAAARLASGEAHSGAKKQNQSGRRENATDVTDGNTAARSAKAAADDTDFSDNGADSHADAQKSADRKAPKSASAAERSESPESGKSEKKSNVNKSAEAGGTAQTAKSAQSGKSERKPNANKSAEAGERAQTAKSAETGKSERKSNANKSAEADRKTSGEPQTARRGRESHSEFTDYSALLDDSAPAHSSDAPPTASERLTLPQFMKKFFSLIFSGELTAAMELAMGGGAYCSLIFALSAVISGVFLGLTKIQLTAEGQSVSTPFAIGGGIILLLEILVVLTLMTELLMLLTNTDKGFVRALGTACASSLPFLVFSPLAFAAALFYQPLALPAMICAVVFTAINLYAAAKASGALAKKGGFIIFCIIFTLFILSAGLITASML